MLQRTPSYIVSLPAKDWFANLVRKLLPAKLAYWAARWKNVLRTMFFYWVARAHPRVMKGLVRAGLRKELGEGYDIRTHFRPPYEPWDQRLCLVPDADLFKSLREGRAEMVTDHIETFTEQGIKLKSGRELAADIVVSATGLNLLLLGGMQMSVDGQPVEAPKTLSYRGMMVSDVPNMAFAVGYTNASWTLKCDLVAEYFCRLINYMDRHGYRQCTPRRTDPTVTEEPLINFSSGYVQRAIDQFPKQGSKMPWKLHQNYARDLLNLRFGALDDGTMEFVRAPVPTGVVGSAHG
jgi:monooxygenase